MALAAAPDVPGHRALSPLGYGPTSTLYSAQSTTLGRWVALTVYTTTLTDDRAQRRFTRAFETARRLGSHPHAVTMLECGLTLDRRPYVATEIYERGTLDGRVAGRKPLKVEEALRIAIAIAGALETAHRADVVHGGVHPARVLVGSDGEPALADLGLVPLVEKGGLAALVGPMSYHTAPEVLEGEPVSPATDVYSLASTLYTILTGRAPYQADGGEGDDTVASLLLRILQHAVPTIGGDVPPSLQALLHRALSCEPKHRPERALAFARGLQECQRELHLPVTEPVVLDIAASLRLAEPEGDRPDPTPRVFIPYPAPDPTAPGDGDRADRPAVEPLPTGQDATRHEPAHPLPGPSGLVEVPDSRDAPGTGGTGATGGKGNAPGPLVDGPGTARQAFAPFPSPPDPPAAPPAASPASASGVSLLPPDDRRVQAGAAFPARVSPTLDEAPAPAPRSDLGPPRSPGTPGGPAAPPAPGGPDDVGDDSSPWPDLPLDPPLRRVDVDEQPDAEGSTGTGRDPKTGAQPRAARAGAGAHRTGETPALPPGPRALPVLVLMGLVAVLIVGVGWMIVTGENPTQEETADPTTRSSRTIERSGSGGGAGRGEGRANGPALTATENATGVQLDWEDTGQGNQVVLVLSATQAPRALPAETGTALLVPTASLLPRTGYCFVVVSAGDGPLDAVELATRLAPGAVPPESCIRGATDSTVRRE
jgi:serine/threonine protein kinase